MSIAYRFNEQSIDTLNVEDDDVQVAMNLHHRSISEEQMRKYESNAALRAEFLSMCGLHT